MANITYPTAHLIEYLPKRYNATDSQKKDRSDVYSFKGGNCPLKIKEQFCDQIKKTVNGNTSDWVVLFIPASTSAKTANRYNSLASYIQSKTGVKTSISGITNKIDTEAKHLSGVSKEPGDVFNFDPSCFKGKKVILIDDVTTSGKSFQKSADLVMKYGAASICGLFLAKTINPDWHGSYSDYYYEDYLEEDEFDPESYYEQQMEEEFDPESYYEQQMEEEFDPESYYEQQMEEEFDPSDYYDQY